MDEAVWEMPETLRGILWAGAEQKCNSDPRVLAGKHIGKVSVPAVFSAHVDWFLQPAVRTTFVRPGGGL